MKQVYIFRSGSSLIISANVKAGFRPIGVYNDPYSLLVGIWSFAESDTPLKPGPRDVLVDDDVLRRDKRMNAGEFGFSDALYAFGYPVTTFTMRALWLMSKADGFPNFANSERKRILAGRR